MQSVRPAFPKILQRQIPGLLLALCISGLCIPRPALSQDERPQIFPGERKPTKKKDTGPRAVGVLQMNPTGKGSLVPIAILINGKFWDASVYKADPVPWALDYGTVYEAERSGNSLGLFTVSSALHRNSGDSTQPAWLGTGTWRPNGSEPEKQPAKAESVPVGMDVNDARPRLTRNPEANKPAESTGPAPSKPSNTPASDTSKPSSSSGDEPPRLSKPASSPEPPAQTSGQSAPTSSCDSKADAAKAPDSKSDSKSETKTESKAADRAKIPASDSGADDANRPKLRRGKPAESFADEDVPGYSKPGTKSTPGDLSKAAPIASQGDVQLIPAISDAHGSDIHSFVFQWLKGEEDDRRKQITDYAKEQVKAYVAAKSKSQITPAPPAMSPRSSAARSAGTRSAGTRAVTTAKVSDPILENVRVVAYDLWVSNQPVMILSAEARVPPAGPGTVAEDAQPHYSVMVVAYPDIYNNLHKLYVGITDKFHLDVTPKLELIDALDADGDGRGELLFREVSDQGTGWVIYRATADKLWKMYDSLRPE